MLDILNFIENVILIIVSYYLILFIFTVIFTRFPRRSFDDYPDWGTVEDHWIHAIDSKKIECWVVYPENHKADENNNTVLFTHGWGRDRGRMVERARHWGKLGFTTILFSSRDHGNSDRLLTGGSIIRFSQDVESVVQWWGKQLILSGHSIGAGANLLVASRNHLVAGVIAEASPFSFPKDLNNIYRPMLKMLTPILIPGIRFTIRIMYRKFPPRSYSPAEVSHNIDVPVLLLYGAKDIIFPVSYAKNLSKIIPISEYFVFENADHSSIFEQAKYFEIIESFLIRNKLFIPN